MMKKRFITLAISLIVSLSATSQLAVKPANNAQSAALIQESKVSSNEVSATYEADKTANEVQNDAGSAANTDNASNSVNPANSGSRGAVSRGTAVRPEPRYGEALDWWKEASSDFPRGAVAEVTDLQTGRSFMVKRTYGTNHADCEALTLEDTNIIKSIWGGFSWDKRPVIVKINGLRIAASMAGMPHAGVDDKPANVTVSNRSGGYGTGTNLDTVKGNGMDGHFDIHFLNSRGHASNKKDPKHQANVMLAAGK